jgi:hypothetical protein
MKRLTIYTILVLALGVAALSLARRAQTQTVPESAVPADETAPQMAMGGTTTPVFSYQGQLLDAQGNPVTGNVPMTFRLYPTATGGTACWTEAHTGGNAVQVQDGRFSLLLGSITPTGPTCLADDAYLELQINSETLSPRQLLTDAIVSNGSQLGETVIGQDVSFEIGTNRTLIFGPSGGYLYLSANRASLRPQGDWFRSSWIWLSSLENSNWPGSATVHLAKDIDQNNSPTFSIFLARSDGTGQSLTQVDQYGNMATAGNVTMNGYDLRMGESGNTSVALRYDENRLLHLLPWGGSGHRFDGVCIGCGSSANLTVNGNLDVNGSCNASIEGDEVTGTGETCTAVRITEDGIQTGAVIELNLMTAAERAAGRIDRFTQGDVLCWSTQTERLEKCTQANTRLVMAVANSKGLPIVQGAEPVKVLGPVTAGDLLVASAVPGYAMVNNFATPGTIIGKALEDFNSESGLIKVMIRQ